MLTGRHESLLVLISVLVAILASATALVMAGRISTSRAAGQPAARWLAGGALAMGTGIWSMHFIGMLAFRLPIPTGYDPGITLWSLLIAIGVSGLALWQVSQPELPPRRLLAGSLLMGAGIAAMHYTGMAAMRMQPGIVYDPLMVAASLAIAVGAAGAALWIAFRLRRHASHPWAARTGAAVVMGMAIAGMHYTGMAAAGFPVDSLCLAAGEGYPPDALALTVAITSFALLGVALLVAVYDIRLQARSETVAVLEAAAMERSALLASEREARAEAERMSAMKDEFLATLSHELRTPLNAVLGWTSLLRHKGANEDELRRGMEVIERNARAQARLIDDLLDMNRILSGGMRLEMAPTHPAAFIAAALETIRPMAQARHIGLDVALDEDAGPVAGDAARLQQVMWNLLANAVKFTPEGGHIQLRLARAAGAIEISVADDGIGIAPDFLPHVFDRFRQADGSPTRRHGGLGLGLSIARQLAELHGGELKAASAGVGCGAVFTLRLPAPPAAAETAADAPAVLSASLASLAGVTVLVVDDEADARELTQRILADCGAEAIGAGSAAEALALLARHAVQVLVSDIGMPETDGYALLRQARAAGLHLPAVALTAFARPEDEARARQAGFAAYVPKPVDAARLVAAVADAASRDGWSPLSPLSPLSRLSPRAAA